MPEIEYGKTTLDLVQSLIERGVEKMSILMRHSDRNYDWEHPEKEPFMTLTEKGKDLSFNLGRQLPQEINVSPFSSVFGRCIETAYLIDKGYASVNGRMAHNQIEEVLSPFFVKNPYELAKIMKAKRPDFVRHWFEGNISSDIIDTPVKAAQNIVQVFDQKLEDQPQSTINIGVTHDWNLYLVKEHIMGLRHEEVGKVDYLEGVAIYREQGQTFITNHQCLPIAFKN